MRHLLGTSLVRLTRRSIAVSGLVWLGIAPSPAAAQLERVQNAFQLARFSVERSGQYVYQYRLLGPQGGKGVAYTDIFVDITSPKDMAPPRILGTRGTFLFDGIARNYATLEYSHPDVFIGTPMGYWMGSVYLQGSVAWAASRYGDGRNYGVVSGQELLGFELRSPALPALRRFRVVPYRHMPGADYAEGLDKPLPVDSSWVIADGAVLAPGWPAELVTVEFLTQQVQTACDAYLLANCGNYLRYTDALANAEATRRDAVYLALVKEFRAVILADAKSERTARYAFDLALQGLARRPPSRRDAVAPPAPAPAAAAARRPEP
jgi:hypothetical protein